jgi:hypothetical protein
MSQSTTLRARPTTGSQNARLAVLALIGLILAILVTVNWPAPIAPVGDSPVGEISPTMAYVREGGAASATERVGALTYVREAPATSEASEITPSHVGEREGTAKP